MEVTKRLIKRRTTSNGILRILPCSMAGNLLLIYAVSVRVTLVLKTSNGGVSDQTRLPP